MSTQEQPKTQNDLSPMTALSQMITGYWISQVIYVAAMLGIADLLKNGPKKSEELAQSEGLDAHSLHRLLRALASIGILVHDEAGRFGLTTMGAYLQADRTDSLRTQALRAGEDCSWRVWGNLIHSIRTGERAFDQVFGMQWYKYLDTHPEAAENFNAGMTTQGKQKAKALVENYNFSLFETAVDVGGGPASIMIDLLKANPKLKGVLFDIDFAVQEGKQAIEREGLADRCSCVSGDFAKGVPSGGDLYLLSNVVHGQPDDRAISLLKHCQQAIPNHGRVLLFERVVPPRIEPTAKMQALMRFDLIMMVRPGGRERTEAEFRSLLAAAGLTLTQVIPTPTPFSIIEGVRV